MNNSVLKEQIRNTLSVSYDDITDFSISYNFNLWLQNKEYVKSILSKSSDWDESRLCVHKKISYAVKGGDVRPAIYLLKSMVRCYCNMDCQDFMLKLIKGETDEDKKNIACTFFYFYLIGTRYKGDGIFLNDAIDDWKNHPFSFLTDECWADSDFITSWLGDFFKVKKGQSIKMTRVLQKIVDLYTKEGMTIDNQKLTSAQDCLISKEYTTALIISIHPCDYLTQSHGRNWTTCHSLRDQGCYHAGIMNMMCDHTSIIIYTLKLEGYYNCLERENQFYPQDKVKRMSAFLNKGVLVLNPLYPDKQNNGTHSSELKFTIVENVLSMLGCQDWDLIDRDNIHFDDSDCWGYDDYKKCSDVMAYTNGSQYNIKIGEDALLVNADNENDTIDDNETLGRDRSMYCENCGERYSDDEMYYVNQFGYVCEDCLNDAGNSFYMCHGDYEYYCDSLDEKIVIDGEDYRLYYAERHLDYVMDEATGEYFTLDGVHYEIYSNHGDYYYFKNSSDYRNYIEEEVLRNPEEYSDFIREHNLLEDE